MSLTKVPSIPVPTTGNQLEVARAIKGILDVREGYIGDPLDQNVTFRDLVDAGAVVERGAWNKNSPLSPVMPPWTETDGYDPTQDYTPPEQPTGFTATAGLATAILQWTQSAARNFAYTEVWRSTTNSIGSAILIGTTDTRFYTDAIGSTGQTRYYWIRFVTQANVTGPYNNTNGSAVSTGLVGGADLTDLIVTAAKLADGAVTAGKIGTSAVTSAKLADLAVDAAKLADSAVTATKIANLAVGTAAIAAAAITEAKIANLAVGNAAIQNLAVTNTKIGDLAVDNAKIASLDAAKINTGFLSADRIQAGTIDAKIANISAAVITSGTISSARIGDASITGAKIANATIGGANIASATITAANIASATITSAQIASATITAANIADATITSAKIGDYIQSTTFSSGSAGWIIRKDGSAEFNGPVISRNIVVASGLYGAFNSSYTIINAGAYESQMSTSTGESWYEQTAGGGGGVYLYIDTGFQTEPWNTPLSVLLFECGVSGGSVNVQYTVGQPLGHVLKLAFVVNRLFFRWNWYGSPTVMAEVRVFASPGTVHVGSWICSGIDWKLYKVT